MGGGGYYFYLLFLTLVVTRHILQFAMFDSIPLQPAVFVFIKHTEPLCKDITATEDRLSLYFLFLFQNSYKERFSITLANIFICSWTFLVWVRITKETPHDSILHRKLRKYKQRFKTRKKNGAKELLPSFKKAYFLYKSSTISLYYKDNVEPC